MNVPSTPYPEVVRMFAERGDMEYFGEPVSQSAHALQAANLAVLDGAPESLVVAALLHDIGHLLHDEGEHIADAGVDARHESLGEAWLSKWFGSDVSEPAALHVDAKRYLCGADAGYLSTLSEASVQSLALQGGPFSGSEVMQFETNPHFREAVRLRRWDDEAKIPGKAVPGLEFYRDMIESANHRKPSAD